MTHIERPKHHASMLPANKVDDGFVLEAGVCGAGASILVAQFQDVVFKRQPLAHLTATDSRAGVPNAHG